MHPYTLTATFAIRGSQHRHSPPQTCRSRESHWQSRCQVLPQESQVDVNSLKLVDGQGTLTLNGTIAEQGDIHLDGDLSTLAVNRLSFLNPRLANATGQVSASYSVRGQTSQPTAQASVSATGILQDPASKDTDRSLRVELAPVTISPTQALANGKTTGGIQLAGSYYYRALSAKSLHGCL